MPVIRKTKIIGANRIVYSAWEPTTPGGGHATITSDRDGYLGRIGTRRINEEDYRGLSYARRYQVIEKFYQKQFEEAYACIRAKYPELDGEEKAGEIVVELEQDNLSR